MTEERPSICPYCGRDCSALGRGVCDHFLASALGGVLRHSPISEQMEERCDQQQPFRFQDLLNDPSFEARGLLRRRVGLQETYYYTDQADRLESALIETLRKSTDLT